MRYAILVIAASCGSEPDHLLHDRSSGDRIRFDGTGVDIATIPQVAAAIGLPVKGTADIAIDIEMPHHDLRKATGTIEITCTACQLGDDTAKLQLDKARDFAPDGIYFGHLAIGTFGFKASLANHHLTVERWSFESPDAKLEVSFEAELARTWDDSEVKGCIRFKADNSLRKRDPKLADAISLTGAAIDKDSFFQIALEGPAGEMRRLAKTCR